MSVVVGEGGGGETEEGRETLIIKESGRVGDRQTDKQTEKRTESERYTHTENTERQEDREEQRHRERDRGGGGMGQKVAFSSLSNSHSKSLKDPTVDDDDLPTFGTRPFHRPPR